MERRDTRRRSAIVRQLTSSLIENPSATFTVDTLRRWLAVPGDAAERILTRLANTGLLREVQRGVYARGSWPGAQRDWY